MARKADAGWTSKNKMPGKIPPFKTPRCVIVVEKEKDTQLQTTRHRKDNSAWGKTMEKELAAIERRMAGPTKTKLQPTEVVIITETEEKESDSEEETQFGVVWEKATEAPMKMAENIKETEAQMKMAENLKTTTSIVIITETEESERQSSDVEEDNISLIQTSVKKDIEISGEASVGKIVMKQFEAGLFCGEVVSATKNRGRFLIMLCMRTETKKI
jgi:hypothetical protein